MQLFPTPDWCSCVHIHLWDVKSLPLNFILLVRLSHCCRLPQLDLGSVPQNSQDPSQPHVRQTGFHLADKESSSQRGDLVEIPTVVGSRGRKKPRALDLHSEGPGITASAFGRTPRTPLCRHHAGPGLMLPQRPALAPPIAPRESALRYSRERERELPLRKEARHVHGTCSKLAGDYSGLKHHVLD